MAAVIDEREREQRREAQQLLREQLTIEGELVALYEKTAGETSNELVSHILQTIRHDSQKHIMLLSILLGFLEGKEIYIKDRASFTQTLDRHLELEKESIKRGEKLLRHGWLDKRKGYKALVESWVEDEKRHHRLLKELSEKSYIPISSDDFAAAFRDEDFFEERYKRSKDFVEKK